MFFLHYLIEWAPIDAEKDIMRFLLFCWNWNGNNSLVPFYTPFFCVGLFVWAGRFIVKSLLIVNFTFLFPVLFWAMVPCLEGSLMNRRWLRKCSTGSTSKQTGSHLKSSKTNLSITDSFTKIPTWKIPKFSSKKSFIILIPDRKRKSKTPPSTNKFYKKKICQ